MKRAMRKVKLNSETIKLLLGHTLEYACGGKLVPPPELTEANTCGCPVRTAQPNLCK